MGTAATGGCNAADVHTAVIHGSSYDGSVGSWQLADLPSLDQRLVEVFEADTGCRGVFGSLSRRISSTGRGCLLVPCVARLCAGCVSHLNVAFYARCSLVRRERWCPGLTAMDWLSGSDMSLAIMHI
jgi:hypothetical protein